MFSDGEHVLKQKGSFLIKDFNNLYRVCRLMTGLLFSNQSFKFLDFRAAWKGLSLLSEMERRPENLFTAYLLSAWPGAGYLYTACLGTVANSSFYPRDRTTFEAIVCLSFIIICGCKKYVNIKNKSDVNILQSYYNV